METDGRCRYGTGWFARGANLDPEFRAWLLRRATSLSQYRVAFKLCCFGDVSRTFFLSI